MPDTTKRLIHGDVLLHLRESYVRHRYEFDRVQGPKLLDRYDCIIADPPDNIGLDYSEYHDRLPVREYRKFLSEFLHLAKSAAPLVWMSFNAKYLFTVGSVVEELMRDLNYSARVFIQTFTFGQHRTVDCGNGYRPILRLKRRDARLYPDAIKVESERQRLGDKRAAPGGKVPLDVWDFPRVTGNSKQRRSWHPTQLHEDLVRRIVDFSTRPGDMILDAFSGTGTVLRVAGDDRNVTSVELDSEYCRRIADEHGLEVEAQ